LFGNKFIYTVERYESKGILLKLLSTEFCLWTDIENQRLRLVCCH